MITAPSKNSQRQAIMTICIISGKRYTLIEPQKKESLA